MKKHPRISLKIAAPAGEKIVVEREHWCPGVYICLPIEIVHYFMLFFKRRIFGRIYAFEVDGYGHGTAPTLNSNTVGKGPVCAEKAGPAHCGPFSSQAVHDSGAGQPGFAQIGVTAPAAGDLVERGELASAWCRAMSRVSAAVRSPLKALK